MIELKPRCAGCGTGNAIDAIFCQECGVGLSIETETASIAEIEAPMASDQQENCIHRTTIQNIQCECVRCLGCDTRTETCHKHTPHFDYGLQTKKKDPLDHLRETLSPKTPFPEDKRLDFRSMQIPDWEFGKEIKEKTKDLNWKVPIMGGGIIKMPDASPEQTRHFMEAYKGEMEKAAKDPNYIPLIATNKDIEIIPFTTTSNLTPQPPYSEVIERDVRKGIPESTQSIINQIEQAQTWGDKPDIATRRGPKPNKEFKWGVSGKDASRPYVKDDLVKKDYTRFLWLFPIIIWSVFIYLSIFT